MVRYLDSILKPAKKQAYRQRIRRCAMDVVKTGRKEKVWMEKSG
jgi:hypothetical protein